MNTILIVSQALLWICLIVTLLLGVVLARQVGVLLQRVQPAGALAGSSGPEVGNDFPVAFAQAMDGNTIAFVDPDAKQRQLLLFVSAQCPVCKSLIPFAKSLAKAERLKLTFAGDANRREQERLLDTTGILPGAFVNDRDLGMALGVDRLPFAVLIDRRGKVASKGLVNSREHLESLIMAEETGFSSIQDFLSSRTHAEELGRA